MLKYVYFFFTIPEDFLDSFINHAMFTDFSEIIVNPDVWIILSFLIVTLLVSYKYGESISTVTEYALASRKLPSPVLIMTFMASTVGANVFLGSAQSMFNDGLIRVLLHLYCIPLFCFWGYVAYKRFDARFDKHITMGDMFKSLFRVEIIC